MQKSFFISIFRKVGKEVLFYGLKMPYLSMCAYYSLNERFMHHQVTPHFRIRFKWVSWQISKRISKEVRIFFAFVELNRKKELPILLIG